MDVGKVTRSSACGGTRGGGSGESTRADSVKAKKSLRVRRWTSVNVGEAGIVPLESEGTGGASCVMLREVMRADNDRRRGDFAVLGLRSGTKLSEELFRNTSFVLESE
jgi:hypothetical protein